MIDLGHKKRIELIIANCWSAMRTSDIINIVLTTIASISAHTIIAEVSCSEVGFVHRTAFAIRSQSIRN